MAAFVLHIDRVEEGTVTVSVVDHDEQADKDVLVWSVTVAQDYTRTAQKAALKATFDYLNQFLDLSQGGRY